MTRFTSDGYLFDQYVPVLLSLVGIVFGAPDIAKAQSVTSAQDGTGTVVIQNGQRFDIDAGSLSADGDNLFHSFQTFQPSSGEIVNFLAEPSIQTIFARIVGGDPGKSVPSDFTLPGLHRGDGVP